jgi:hypothetical protein
MPPSMSVRELFVKNETRPQGRGLLAAAEKPCADASPDAPIQTQAARTADGPPLVT